MKFNYTILSLSYLLTLEQGGCVSLWRKNQVQNIRAYFRRLRRNALDYMVDQRAHGFAQSNQALITVLESIDADVYVSDFETNEILFANKHIREGFNEDLVGKICYKVFRNESSVCAHCNNNKLLNVTGQPTGDLIWEDRNPITGQWYKNSDRAIRWHDGHYVHLQIANDITEHKQAQEEIQKQMHVQDALRKAGAAISSTLDIETVLARIAEQMGQAIDSTSAYINSYEPMTGMSSVIAEYIGPGANAAERVSVLDVSYQEDGYVEFLEMMQAGQHDVAHVGEADLTEYERAEMQEKGVKSILYIPLRIRGELIGYTELRETRQHRHFTPEEITLCQDLAQQAALAIEHARLYGSIAQELTERVQAEVALRESEERYRNLFNSVPVGIYRSTPDGRFLDGNPALMKILGYPDQETMLAANIKDLYLDGSIREQELALIEQGDVVSNHRMQLRRYDDAVIWVQDSASAVRDSSGQTVHYYGRLEDITERVWTEMELQRANKQLQTHLAEIKELEAALREQATRDPLTGVFNRRYMDEVLQQELARAARKGGALSVVILDLDHLKEINDTYGHVAGGDKALQTLADTLKQMCRAEDTLCRYGGDEFLVILHDTPAQVACERAMQWKEAVAKIKFSSSDMEFRVTFSAGIATFSSQSSTGEDILIHADSALYRAKELGRDQVVIYQQGSST